MAKVRLPNGELRDEIRQVAYDTETLTAGGAALLGERSFFSNVQGKALWQTNLRQNNLFEATVSYRCLGICVDAQNIYAANVNVLPLLMDNSSFSFRVAEKIYWQGSGVYATGRMEQRQAAAIPADGTEINQVYQRYGHTAVQPVMFSGMHAIDIEPLTSFSISWVVAGLTAAEQALTTFAADSRIHVRASLKGLQRRPVQ